MAYGYSFCIRKNVTFITVFKKIATTKIKTIYGVSKTLLFLYKRLLHGRQQSMEVLRSAQFFITYNILI